MQARSSSARLLAGVACSVAAVGACDAQRSTGSGGTTAATTPIVTVAPDSTDQHDPTEASDQGDPSSGIGPWDLSGIETNGARGWLGIPFAQPPVGELRWRPPAPAAEWTGIRDATRFSEPCPQPTGVFVADEGNAGSWFGDEDCLYLNVWAPAGATPGTNLPVMLFLHGGGNFAGSTSDTIAISYDTDDPAVFYDGARLATTADIVVVTTNYRLGALGFLASDALDEEGDGSSGNYGLLDQIAALEWIDSNIMNFGGDPEHVLLVGQSGGGRDALLLATSAETAGLIDAVAIHSAPLGARPKPQAVAQGEALTREVGCARNDLACLRTVPPADLILADAAQPDGLAGGAFRPIVDGRIVVDQPMNLLAAGDVPDIPWIIGTNDAEYAHRWTTMTDEAYPAAVTATQGVEADAVASAYPLDSYESAAQAFGTLMADRNVTCPTRRMADAATDAGLTVYVYRFGQITPAEGRLADGAYHTSELLYLFQHLDGTTLAPNPGDTETGRAMAAYWASFAADGDPRHDDAPTWQPYRSSERSYLYIAGLVTAGTDLAADRCDFWDSLL